MKTYIKPDTEVMDVTAYGVFADGGDLYAHTGTGLGTIRAKRNDAFFDEEEAEEEGLW